MLAPLLIASADEDSLMVALTSGADALVIDLADEGSPAALARLQRLHSLADRPRLVVRVAGLDDPGMNAALDAAMAGAPDAVLLAGAVGAVDVQHLAAKLAVLEAEHGLAAASTGILAAAADTARGVLALTSMIQAGPRLEALIWGGGALTGEPSRVARAMLSIAAGAAGVPAIDAGSDSDGEVLWEICHAARPRRLFRQDGTPRRSGLAHSGRFRRVALMGLG